jgi:hypothetical protein
MSDGYIPVSGVVRWITRDGKRIQQTMWIHRFTREIQFRDIVEAKD